MIPNETELDDFCVFILTHGRPNTVKTYKTLKQSGYTGRVYIVIDNEDKQADEYYKIYGDKVIMFDKKAIAQTFDAGDNFNDRRAIIYARNACFDIAKSLGITYFMQLDDDYMRFLYKIDETFNYKETAIKNLDKIFSLLLIYYKSIPALSIAMAQNGDFIGGKKGSLAQSFKAKRKSMNVFICSTERPFQFFGRINEDVNTYVTSGGRGHLFMTIPVVAIIQLTTQKNSGGMTDLYLDSGTYIKSFYSVMYSPSCVKIHLMGSTHKRLHHSISWKNAVPVIIDEKFKKY